MAKYFNSALSQSLGNLTTWKQERYGLTGETDHGKFRLLVYNDHTIRIQITKHDEFEDFSYAVIVSPEAQGFTILDQPDNIVLKTPSVVLTITKYPVRFSFYTHHGQVINEDDQFG